MQNQNLYALLSAWIVSHHDSLRRFGIICILFLAQSVTAANSGVRSSSFSPDPAERRTRKMEDYGMLLNFKFVSKGGGALAPAPLKNTHEFQSKQDRLSKKNKFTAQKEVVRKPNEASREAPAAALKSDAAMIAATIPHKFSKHKGSVFPFGCADSTTSDGRRGSSVYEVNTWLWNFGCGKPHLGGLHLDKTSMRKKTVREDQARHSVETRRRRRARMEHDQMKCADLLKSVPVRACRYVYVLVCT